VDKQADAIIIEAGILEAAIAFELAKKGWQPLTVEKHRTSGYGSTSNTCIRLSFFDKVRIGCAMIEG